VMADKSGGACDKDPHRVASLQFKRSAPVDGETFGLQWFG
jgi:hypothetical protein